MSVNNRKFDPNINYYAVLQVSQDASRTEVIRSYRQLMRRSHPDNFTDRDKQLQAEERAKELNAAFSVLSRPEVRREYDMAIRRSVMADTIRDRYRGGRPQPSTAPRPRTRAQGYHRPRREPTIQAREAQRKAFKGAIWQLVITFAGIAVALILLIILGNVALEGARLLFS